MKCKLTIMRLALLCLTIFAGLITCKKENLDVESFSQCNKAQNLDSSAITAKLIGSWTWATQSCFWANKSKSAYRNTKVIFKSNHTFSVNKSSNTLSQGTWKVRRVGGNSWGLDLSSPSELLYGRILFCDNQVLFYNSDLDGCDNLFNKHN